jgi:hypothetical protein
MIIKKSNENADEEQSMIGSIGGSSLMLKPISAPNSKGQSLEINKVV